MIIFKKLVATFLAAFLGLGAALAGPVIEGLYHLGEDGVNTDSSGKKRDFSAASNGTTGTDAPAVLWVPAGNEVVTSTKYLDGPGVLKDNGYKLPADNFGVEFAVRVGDLNSFGTIFSNGGGGTGRGVEIAYTPTDLGNGVGLSASYSDVGFIGDAYQPADSSEWVTIAVVVDGGKTSFYVNGQPHGAYLPIAPHPVAAGDCLVLGGRADGSAVFQGGIDELRLFTFRPGKFTPADLLSIKR